MKMNNNRYRISQNVFTKSNEILTTDFKIACPLKKVEVYNRKKLQGYCESLQNLKKPRCGETYTKDLRN